LASEDADDPFAKHGGSPPGAAEQAPSLPTYARLRELVRSEIERGDYDRRRLPTDLELVQRFGVSRHTVRQAMSELVAEGLIRREPGRGTFATGVHNSKYVRALGNVDDLMALAADTTLKVLSNLHEVRDEQIARRLGLTDDLVVGMVILRFRHARPLGCAHVYLPPSLADLLEPLSTVMDHHASIIHLVQRTTNVTVSGADQDITAVKATPEIARILQVTEGVPLLRIERVYHARERSPVEFAISHYRPDRYTYRVALRGKSGW
jgi:GntR family transcriptional regulator